VLRGSGASPLDPVLPNKPNCLAPWSIDGLSPHGNWSLFKTFTGRYPTISVHIYTCFF
jgi:hypothetical protein